MVVRVTKTEFELDYGRIFQHPVELDDVPTIEEFQKIFRCLKWGYEDNADSNASLNILLRFITGLYGACCKPEEVMNFNSGKIS